MLYSFDTSTILNGRRDLFRPTVFRGVWELIEDAITAGEVRSVDEVRRELAKRDDDAKQWADAQTDPFCPLDAPIRQSATQILRLHPNLVKQGGQRSGADPFVIALAMANQGRVVSEETASGNIDRPRIPDVCGAIGVPCLTLMDYIEEQGWAW